ncbi:MAG: hypothetical protein K2X95_05085 [Flavobacteriaceae bacterium]|nr:hypothetical protein [Flavobacteriaceae bacterium]
MKKIIVLFVLFLISCNSQNNHLFLDNFQHVTKEELKKNVCFPKNIKWDNLKILNSSNLDLLNYFQIPINEMDYKYSFLPSNKNKYRFSYKYRISDNYYIVSYIENYGYLTEHSQFLCVYNFDKDKIVSKLNISSSGIKTIRDCTYDGEIFTVKIIYNSNIEFGFDPTPEQQKPKEVIEKYRINEDFVFEKLN